MRFRTQWAVVQVRPCPYVTAPASPATAIAWLSGQPLTTDQAAELRVQKRSVVEDIDLRVHRRFWTEKGARRHAAYVDRCNARYRGPGSYDATIRVEVWSRDAVDDYRRSHLPAADRVTVRR